MDPDQAYVTMKRTLSVFAFLTCYVPYSLSVKSSCMAPPVKFGEDATLSCHFDKDLSKFHRDVIVYLYKDTEYPVVIYAWHDGQAKIHTMEGYRCEGNISDYLVIKIANVNENNAGQYSCVVALSQAESTTCTLRITGLPLHSSVVAVGKVTNNLLDVLSTESVNSFKVTEQYIINTRKILIEQRSSDGNHLYTASIALGALFLVLVVIFLILLTFAIINGWIPTCCSTSKNQDLLNGKPVKTGNSKVNNELMSINKRTINMEEGSKQKLIESV